MKIIVTDTETSGLPLFKEKSEDPRQPHIVELAALLIDDVSGEIAGQMRRIIRPDGWVIPVETSEIHGITTERAMDEGIPEADALAEYLDLHRQAQRRVAHNVTFDDRILRIGLKRFGDGRAYHDTMRQEEKEAIADEYRDFYTYCTMRETRDVLKLPPTEKQIKAGFGKGYKQPKLSEAFFHYFGVNFDGAHSALNDARACADVYFAVEHGLTVPMFSGANEGA